MNSFGDRPVSRLKAVLNPLADCGGRSRLCRLQHQVPTSHEVGMRTGMASLCRLQHQEPTSHEVGMRTRMASLCRLQHQVPTSHEVGMRTRMASLCRLCGFLGAWETNRRRRRGRVADESRVVVSGGEINSCNLSRDLPAREKITVVLLIATVYRYKGF